MGYLVIKGNNQTRSYSLANNVPAKPYLKVSSGYLNLTTANTTGLRLNVKVNNIDYRPIASSTYTSTNSSYTTTRRSDYTRSSTSRTTFYGSNSTYSYSSTWKRTVLYGIGSAVSTYCNNQGGNADACKAGATAAAYNLAYSSATNWAYNQQETRSVTTTITGQFLPNGVSSSTSYINSTVRTSTLVEQKNYAGFNRVGYSTTYACNFSTYDGGNYGTYTGRATYTGSCYKTYHVTYYYKTSVTARSYATRESQTSRASTYTDYYTQTSTYI